MASLRQPVVHAARGPGRVTRVVGLPRDFYDRPTLEVARDLIGKLLVHDGAGGRTSGIIVEAEAYIGEADPACHAASGPTARNAPLYGPPGFAYVYFNYGMHYLVNAVTEPAGQPAAVLVRALEPLEGLDLMRTRRGARRGQETRPLPDHALCRGPGNLSCALGIDLSQNRLDLCGSPLTIEDSAGVSGPVVWSPRIGISAGTEQWWRVFVRDHGAVSGPRVLHAESATEPRSFPWGPDAPRRRAGRRPAFGGR